MGVIIDALPGTYFTLRIYKKLTTNPSLMWANSYEFVNLLDTTEANINTLIATFFALEQDMHLEDVEFDRAVFSTWVPDGEPYDPNSFITQPLNGVGNTVSLLPLSLNYCLFVRRQTLTGQNGKLFWRRVMNEQDVQSPAGPPALTNPVTMQTRLLDAVTASGADNYMNGSEPFQLVMKSALLLQRDITALIVAGARVIQYNNRYFDVP